MTLDQPTPAGLRMSLPRSGQIEARCRRREMGVYIGDLPPLPSVDHTQATSALCEARGHPRVHQGFDRHQSRMYRTKTKQVNRRRRWVGRNPCHQSPECPGQDSRTRYHRRSLEREPPPSGAVSQISSSAATRKTTRLPLRVLVVLSKRSRQTKVNPRLSGSSRSERTDAVAYATGQSRARRPPSVIMYSPARARDWSKPTSTRPLRRLGPCARSNHAARSSTAARRARLRRTSTTTPPKALRARSAAAIAKRTPSTTSSAADSFTDGANTDYPCTLLTSATRSLGLSALLAEHLKLEHAVIASRGKEKAKTASFCEECDEWYGVRDVTSVSAHLTL